MTKKIPFGNSEGFIVDDKIKSKVIDFLYSKLDLTEYRYTMLNNIQRLKFLQENEHYCAPNFKGHNFLIMMLTIDEKHYCVVIDRKKLSYHKNQIDMRTIQIIQIYVKTTEALFRGSIFDGKIIQKNKESIFLIQDVYYLMGNKLLDMNMENKINHLNDILDTQFDKEKSYCTNFLFKLNKIYKYSELEEMINGLHKMTIPTNGIIFYPKVSGINIIFIETKTDKVNINTQNTEIIENKSYHIIHDFVDFLKSRTYSYEQNGQTSPYWLSRTLIPDVYDISEKENGEKIGIALIPNLKISQMCDNIIKDSSVLFNCTYSTKFKKWIPLNII
jgi:hypothetical protein